MTMAATPRRIAALDSGTYYHHESLYGERYSNSFDRIIYARDLPSSDLSDSDVLIVTCRTDPSLLIPATRRIREFLSKGKTVVAMGSTGPHLWLDGVSWHDYPTNFWWWTEPEGDLGLVPATPAHPFFDHVPFSNTIWHHHGFFDLPAGAVSIVEARGMGSVLYVDEASSPGTLIVTALDPFYHHGSFFMPATTRFLDGFLPWLRQGQFSL